MENRFNIIYIEEQMPCYFLCNMPVLKKIFILINLWLVKISSSNGSLLTYKSFSIVSTLVVWIEDCWKEEMGFFIIWLGSIKDTIIVCTLGFVDFIKYWEIQLNSRRERCKRTFWTDIHFCFWCFLCNSLRFENLDL